MLSQSETLICNPHIYIYIYYTHTYPYSSISLICPWYIPFDIPMTYHHKRRDINHKATELRLRPRWKSGFQPTTREGAKPWEKPGTMIYKFAAFPPRTVNVWRRVLRVLMTKKAFWKLPRVGVCWSLPLLFTPEIRTSWLQCHPCGRS